VNSYPTPGDGIPRRIKELEAELRRERDLRAALSRRLGDLEQRVQALEDAP
jgi:polyhydroxyalkanoate synthesis regulator phasin